MKPLLTIIFGDTHSGSNTALAPTKFSLIAGNVEIANPFQAWLNKLWTDDWNYVKKLAKGHRVCIVDMGDCTEGDHHGSIDCLPDTDDHVAMAAELRLPAMNLADEYFLVYGTEVHSGQLAQYEKAMAKELGIGVKNQGYSHLIDLDGHILDVAHHGTGTPDSMIRRVMEDCSRDGRQLPRFVVRGHRHVIVDSGEKYPRIRAFTTPSWQLRTAYGRKVSDARADIGMVIIEKENVQFLRHTPRPDTVRTVGERHRGVSKVPAAG